MGGAKIGRGVALLVAIAAGLLFGRADGRAAVKGVCSDCHVMHASQVGLTTTPHDFLLLKDCLGCHTGTNTTNSSTPFVYSSSDPSGKTLAGGNFWYADGDGGGQNRRNGHNPKELPGGPDSTGILNPNPPGWVGSGFALNGQVDTIDSSHSLTCAGSLGCHGTHDDKGVKGGHHTHQKGAADGSAVGKSYRFLFNIKGYEADDYELNPSVAASHHNVYSGQTRSSDTPGVGYTISYFCAECHGVFHSGSGTDDGLKAKDSANAWGSPWIRHPVDFFMTSIGGEGANYTTYTVDVPLAVSITPTADADPMSNSSGRIIMCLTCHRAHASPYPSALRWDMTTMKAGEGIGNTNGCFRCHTTKN